MTLSLLLARRATKCLPPGAVALYLFNEGSGQVLTDYSGNSNGGQLGSTTGEDTNDPAWGVPGLTFAADDWVATALKGLFAGPGTPFSVVAVTKDAVSGTIVARAGATSSSRTFQLGVHAPGSGERYYVTLRGTQTTLVSSVGGTKAITVTWDGTTATGYDGTTAIPVAVGTAAEETAETVLIGARTAAAPEIGLVGSIAALAIYPYALSDAQVGGIYAYLKNRLATRGVVLP